MVDLGRKSSLLANASPLSVSGAVGSRSTLQSHDLFAEEASTIKTKMISLLLRRLIYKVMETSSRCSAQVEKAAHIAGISLWSQVFGFGPLIHKLDLIQKMPNI